MALLLLACGILLSATINHGSTELRASPSRLAALDPPVFTVSSGRGVLLLQGTTVSNDHEARLLKLAEDEFANHETRSDFRPGVILARNWESTSNRLLHALATMQSSHAILRTHSIEIRGVTTDAETFEARLDSLREILLAETSLSSDVVVVDSTIPFDELCTKAFSRLIAGPVSFRQSSTEIRPASFVLLDRVTNFAHDCRHARIAVTGHTDASGDESWNKRLSMARAQAVADHLVKSGIDPERLLVRGLGSSVPVADNSTAHGRGLNRRIEFELR